MEKIKLLTNLGLTEYEAKAYLTLLSFDIAEAKDIYKKAKISFGKIYDVLDSLCSMGFLEIQNSRPKRYKAIMPRIAIKNYTRNREKKIINEIENFKIEAEKVIKKLHSIKPVQINKELFHTASFDVDEINLISLGVDKDAKHSIYAVITKSPKDEDIDEEAVKNFYKKNSKFDFKAIVNSRIVKKKQKQFSEEIRGLINTRVYNNIDQSFLIIDRRIVVLIQADPINEKKNMMAFKIWNEDLAEKYIKKFDTMWKKAKPLPKI